MNNSKNKLKYTNKLIKLLFEVLKRILKIKFQVI